MDFEDLNFSSSDEESIQARPSKVSLTELKKSRGRPKKEEQEKKANKKQKIKEILSDYKRLKDEEENKKISTKVEDSLPTPVRFENIIEQELKQMIDNIPRNNKFLGQCLRKISQQYIGEGDTPPLTPYDQPPPPPPPQPQQHIERGLKGVYPLEESEPEIIVVKKKKPKKAKIVYAETSESDAKPKRKYNKKEKKEQNSETEQEYDVRPIPQRSLSFF